MRRKRSKEIALEPEVQEKTENLPQNGFDIDCLAKAVAAHETSAVGSFQACSNPYSTSARRNNCFGIMTWPNGVRTPKYYETKEDSFDDFKRIWQKSYGGLPNMEKARRWSGNDNAHHWHKNVNDFYNRCVNNDERFLNS